jgi:hypothetical protein
MNDRFLYVPLAAVHADYANREGLPDALVLELLDGQWALYCLDSTGKIDFAVLRSTLVSLTQRQSSVSGPTNGSRTFRLGEAEC